MLTTIEEVIKELSKYPADTKVSINGNDSLLIEYINYIDNSKYDKALTPRVVLNIVDVSED